MTRSTPISIGLTMKGIAQRPAATGINLALGPARFMLYVPIFVSFTTLCITKPGTNTLASVCQMRQSAVDTASWRVN